MKLAAKKIEQASAWKELVRRKEDFLKIVQLLVDFDEKTGRYARYRDTETHFMRRAIASADAEKVRIFLRHLGGFVYSIVAEVQSPGGFVATAWVVFSTCRPRSCISASRARGWCCNPACFLPLYR